MANSQEKMFSQPATEERAVGTQGLEAAGNVLRDR